VTGANEVVLSIIIISTISNLLVDIFGEVLLEYGVVYTRQHYPEFWLPGFGNSGQAAATTDGQAALIEQLSLHPEIIDRLSVEQLQSLLTALGAG